MSGVEPTSQECPSCGLLSPSIAERCDCGFDFATKRIASSYARPNDENIQETHGMTVAQVGLRNIETGVTFMIVGVVVGVAIGIATDGLTQGRLVLLPWGAAVGGLGIACRGIGQYRRGKKLDP